MYTDNEKELAYSNACTEIEDLRTLENADDLAKYQAKLLADL
jgi:hypothetical protein